MKKINYLLMCVCVLGLIFSIFFIELGLLRTSILGSLLSFLAVFALLLKKKMFLSFYFWLFVFSFGYSFTAPIDILINKHTLYYPIAFDILVMSSVFFFFLFSFFFFDDNGNDYRLFYRKYLAEDDVDIGCVCLFFIVFFAYCLLSFGYIGMNRAEYYKNIGLFYSLIKLILPVCGCMVFGYYFSEKNKGIIGWLFFYFFVCYFIIEMFFLGDRRIAVGAILYCLYVIYVFEKISPTIISLLVFALAAFVIVIPFFRDGGGFDSINISLSGLEFGAFGLVGQDVLASNDIRFYNGFLNSIQIIIPKILLVERPLSLEQLYSSVFYADVWDKGGGFAYNIVVDAYMSGAVLGLVLIPIVMGTFFILPLKVDYLKKYLSFFYISYFIGFVYLYRLSSASFYKNIVVMGFVLVFILIFSKLITIFLNSKYLNRDYVFFVGSTPSPIGGVTIFNERFIAKMRSDGELLVHGDPRSPLSMLRVLFYSVFFRRSTIIVSSSSVIVFCFVVVFGVKKIKFIDHNASKWFSQKNKISKYITKLFLVKTAKIFLVSPHLEGYYKEYNLKDGSFEIIPVFIPPSTTDDVKIINNYPDWLQEKVLHSKGDNSRNFVVISAWKPIFISKREELYGLDFFLEVLTDIAPAFSNYTFVFFIGMIDDSLESKDLYNKLRVFCERNSNVKMIVGQYQLWPLLFHTKVFVRPTQTDGDSISIREALWAGCHVLASDVVPRPEQVNVYKYLDKSMFINQISGLLVGGNE
jgi:hypothetical protein